MLAFLVRFSEKNLAIIHEVFIRYTNFFLLAWHIYIQFACFYCVDKSFQVSFKKINLKTLFTEFNQTQKHNWCFKNIMKFFTTSFLQKLIVLRFPLKSWYQHVKSFKILKTILWFSLKENFYMFQFTDVTANTKFLSVKICCENRFQYKVK